MIASLKGKIAEQVKAGNAPKGFPPNLVRRAQRTLRMIEAAVALDDLKIPPGNRLHALTGDRAGQHSVSINDQWRVCFRWQDGAAHDVEIVDYH